MKETQGSVEVTSFGQMDNIQKYGCYTVTGKRDVTIHSIHDVIQLTLTPPAGTKLLKKSYSLDELRDLESKLVLITGSKAENRAAVEQFLDVCYICLCGFEISFFSLADAPLCVSDCRGAHYSSASGPCAVHWLEDGLLLSE